jgi:hypothetical protein
VSICKSKWTNLRNSFARELREHKNTNSGSVGLKKKKWYLFDRMNFLTDFMLQHKKIGGNISHAYLKETKECIESEEEQDAMQVEESAITESEPDSRQLVFKKPKKNIITARKLYKTPSEKVAESKITFLKLRTDKAIYTEDPSELLFFKSLLPDYKKLNEKNQRRFKNAMLTTLNNYLDKQEENIQMI